ncbi:MAG TPA: hypothetical protein VKY19_04550 [Ktedonosporobacter sp.]|jgi:hypothetical protein|nr:hypothetical protein [Ktedonosporobacter sp.]
MGWDITGFIECRQQNTQEPDASWAMIENLYPLYRGRNYDSFGCLFGWKNFAHFRPIARGRGLPPDVSPEIRNAYAEAEEYAAGTTWISWSEIKAIDWEEESEQADSRIHRYERNEQGELVYKGKAAWSREFMELVNSQQLETEAGTMLSIMEALFVMPTRPEGQQWEKGNVVYKAEKLKRKEACSDWHGVFDAMQKLATTYGDDGVRLVVWFVF